MRRVQFTETILRDGNQSLMATRLPYSDYEAILPVMDQAGYYSIECWGGATFDSCLRYLNEDPWERLKNLRKKLPHARIQMLFRGQNILGYKHYHDDVVEKFVELSIKNGVDVIRIFDALNDFRNIKSALEAVRKYGTDRTIASGCMPYTQSPVHTVEKYVEMSRELVRMGFDTIAIKDMAGTMSPYEAEHLIKGIKDAVGDVPVILHTHCTTGMAYMTVLKAIESGLDVVDTATSCFSGGTSQPATETLFYALQQYGIETGLNEKAINKINEFFKPIRQKYIDNGVLLPKSMATDPQALVYKVPGGMLSNMMANLIEMNAMDKFEEALLEIPAVRKDLGYPPLVTPLSQMVGNQAVVNVITGQKYSHISTEVKNYFKGEYGIAPAPVSQELQAKIIGEGNKPVDCRVEDSKRTGKEFEKAKAELGELCRSEEDMMSYLCFPDQTKAFLENRRKPAEHIVTDTATEMDDMQSASQPTPQAAPAPAMQRPQPVIPASGNVVPAPLPGTIIHVAVSVGQRVKAGDVLVILEAMKMENEIVAPQDGVVAQITVQQKTKVSTGDPLVVLAYWHKSEGDVL